MLPIIECNAHRYSYAASLFKHASLHIWTRVENDETFKAVKYFEWYNPVIQKYLNNELTEYELVNEIFELFEQVSQV